MSIAIRVTAQVLGPTVLNRKDVVLERTAERRIRIIREAPGRPPVVLLDAPPEHLRKVGDLRTSRPPS